MRISDWSSDVCSSDQVRFHAADGAGYALVADKVLELDALNPPVAARLLGAFKSWRQFEPKRRELMSQRLARISGTEGISRRSEERRVGNAWVSARRFRWLQDP